MAPPDFVAAFAAIPFGTHRARFRDTDWLISKTTLAGGRAEKLLARELGGNGYVSLNLYHLEAGPLLKPCEMPQSAAIEFVEDLQIG
ncbi:MAG: hypothetical protein AAGA70_02360 [Pseudomonadota bacterium]